MIIGKDYLGDAVYVAFDGFALVLTTEDGYSATNTIVMEPEVLAALLRYKARLDAAIAEHNRQQTTQKNDPAESSPAV